VRNRPTPFQNQQAPRPQARARNRNLTRRHAASTAASKRAFRSDCDTDRTTLVNSSSRLGRVRFVRAWLIPWRFSIPTHRRKIGIVSTRRRSGFDRWMNGNVCREIGQLRLFALRAGWIGHADGRLGSWQLDQPHRHPLARAIAEAGGGLPFRSQLSMTLGTFPNSANIQVQPHPRTLHGSPLLPGSIGAKAPTGPPILGGDSFRANSPVQRNGDSQRDFRAARVSKRVMTLTADSPRT
jgi:hypothetical protein